MGNHNILAYVGLRNSFSIIEIMTSKYGNLKKALPAILLGFLLITLLDGVSSIASRQLNFNYGSLFPLALIIYTAVPFYISKMYDSKMAIISGGLLGLFDSTIGWIISILLKANIGNRKLVLTPVIVILTIIFVTILSTLLGLLGSWLAKKSSPKKGN